MTAIGSDPALAGQGKTGVEALLEEFCPPLEAGLVYALASDFDLNDPDSLKTLQNTLDELRGSAVVEQDLELLPYDEVTATQAIPGAFPQQQLRVGRTDISSRQSRSSPRSVTDDEAVNSVTTGISGLKSSDVDGSDFGGGSGYGEASLSFDILSDHDKCEWLAGMFPEVKVQDVKDVLARCEGAFDRSIDELLNISFLKQSKDDPGNQEFVVPKGIEAFMQENNLKTKGKGRGKRQRNQNYAESRDLNEPWGSDSAMSSGTATPNVWKDLPEDVEFIASRTSLRPKTIMSVYHANGARLAPTVRALAIKEGEIYVKKPDKVDEIIEWQMDELRPEFSHLPDSQIYGVLMLANKMPSTAKELLDIMVSSNEQPVILGKVTGLASYTPLNLSEDEIRPKRVSKGTLPTMVPVTGGVYTTTHLANAQGQAATQAFQQASAAYRRGKSDHLMGGAAAYYASVGHEKIKAAKSVQAAAADAHVAAQSSSTKLDLHGVNVSDAVRIAQNGTEAWWEGLGDRKYVVGGKGNGYRIVTGVGRHSSDGTSRIGPAVSKMLVREGWKVEVGTGEIVVSGRARR